jgi:flavin reductase
MPIFDEHASLASIDIPKFKATMRCIASTVTVITSRLGAVLNGMTATAVCSVSAMPPCILVVVNRDSRSHSMIERAGVFAVNVLSRDQIAVAEHFAAKLDGPLDEVDHRLGLTGVPIIDECVAHIECVLESQSRAGTHSVFFGRIVSAEKTDRQPLIYHDGKFVL